MASNNLLLCLTAPWVGWSLLAQLCSSHFGFHAIVAWRWLGLEFLEGLNGIELKMASSGTSGTSVLLHMESNCRGICVLPLFAVGWPDFYIMRLSGFPQVEANNCQQYHFYIFLWVTGSVQRQRGRWLSKGVIPGGRSHWGPSLENIYHVPQIRIKLCCVKPLRFRS